MNTIEACPPVPATHAAFDPSLRFVRRRSVRPNGFVEFEFAIGEPGIFIEMVLEPDAFEDFCAGNHVVFLDSRSQPEEQDTTGSGFDWHPSDAVERGIGTP